MKTIFKHSSWGIIILLSISLFSQSNQKKISKIQNNLQAIQKEIKTLESQLRTAGNKLKVETKSIENIDKQINLTQNKIKIYNDNIKRKKVQINILEVEIDSLGLLIKSLQTLLAEQVTFAYKYQRGKQYDWILGASSFNDALIRYNYFQKVTLAETSTIVELNKSQVALATKEGQFKNDIKSLNEYLSAAKREDAKLKNKRNTQSKLISKIKQNKTLLAKSLNEKRESYKKLAKMIASLEKGKPTRKLNVETQLKWEKLTGSFSKNRARLNWPVNGALLHGYGKFKNPKLKTVLNNTGIDIKAPLGENVRCIFSGVVSLITYMSGFGNTVIIDHNDSYYSVYAHLDQILVNSGDFIKVGDVIGTVGESGSLEGPKLHLEIYGNNRTLNPVDWLKKNK